jgi:hypothetical protein
MAVNPAAVAWYLTKSEDLLGDHRDRVESLRERAGQLAAFSAAILTLAGADAHTILVSLNGVARSCAGICLLLGSALLIAASITALRGALAPRLGPEPSAKEVANYATERFVEEADLWRVQLRTIRTLRISIASTTLLIDRAAKAIETAQLFFFGGLSLIGGALGTLVVVVTF